MTRGRLKIFLGYAAGVGKTYAMLEAACQRKADGVNVLAALVDTHGLPESEVLLRQLRRSVMKKARCCTSFPNTSLTR